MNGLNFLDPIVAVGVLANAIKLGDLLLTPDQQKAVQRIAETITLQLDYTRPLNWLRGWLRAKNGSIFLWFTIGLVVFSNTAQILAGEGLFGILILPALPETYHTPAKVFGLLITLTLVPFLVFRFGLRAVQWLVADARLFQLFLRYLIGALIGSIGCGLVNGLLMLPMLIVTSFIPGLDDPQSAIALSFLISFPIFETVITILMVPGLAVVCMYVLVPLEFFLVLLRGFAWRVVLYSKGAWAALLLFGTAALAVCDIALKAHK